MKKIGSMMALLALTAGAAGCSSAYYASAGYSTDDLYAIHNKTEIAQRQQAQAEAAKAEAEARRAQWEARIAEAEAAASERRYYAAEQGESYNSVLADTYESAYARRLRGFSSPTYRMPSSYYNYRYGSTFNYVSAYDPAFYNVMVMGDEVWVEPKYITSMFGTWGRPAVYVDPWYYGWNYNPYYYGGWGFSVGSWGWNFGWSWYDPWYHPWWGPSWGPGWHGRPPHYAGHHHRPTYYNRPGGRNPGYTPGRPTSGNHYGSGSYQPGSRTGNSPFQSSGSRGGSYTNGSRNSSGSSNASRGSGYSSGQSSSGYRYGTGSRNSNPSGSYNSGSSNRGSYSGGSSSRGTGSSGGSYNSGGSRGGSSSGGGRGYGGR